MASSSKIYTSTVLIEAIRTDEDYASVVQKIEEDKANLNTIDSLGKPALAHALSRYKKNKNPESAAIIVTLLENNADQTHPQIKTDLEQLPSWVGLFKSEAIDFAEKRKALEAILDLQIKFPQLRLKVRWLFQIDSYYDDYQMCVFAKSLLNNTHYNAAIAKFERSFSLYIANPAWTSSGFFLENIKNLIKQMLTPDQVANTKFKAYMALSRIFSKVHDRNTQHNPEKALYCLKLAKEILNTYKEALAHIALIEYHTLSACINEDGAFSHYESAAKLGDSESAFIGFDLAVSQKHGLLKQTFIEHAIKNAFASRNENTIEEALERVKIFKRELVDSKLAESQSSLVESKLVKPTVSNEELIDKAIARGYQNLAEGRESKNEIPRTTSDNAIAKFNSLEIILSAKISPKKTIFEPEFKVAELDEKAIIPLREKWEQSVEANQDEQAKIYSKQLLELIIHLNCSQGNFFPTIIRHHYKEKLIKAQQVLIQSFYIHIIKNPQIKNYILNSNLFASTVLSPGNHIGLSKEDSNIYSHFFLDGLYLRILENEKSAASEILEGQVKVLAEGKIKNLDAKVRQKAKKLLRYVESKDELCHDAHVLNSLPALQHLEQRLATRKHGSGKEKICGRIYVCTKICFLLLTRNIQSLHGEYGYIPERIDYFIKRNQDFLKRCMQGDKDLFVDRGESDKKECIEFAKWCNSFVENARGKPDLQSYDADAFLLKSSSMANAVVKKRLQIGRKTAGVKVSWLDAALGLWSSKLTTNLPKQAQAVELKAVPPKSVIAGEVRKSKQP